MLLLWRIADFGRAMHRQMRFGELSRAPLRLLRVEWKGDVAECDWLARPADEWDRDLPRDKSERNFSGQALQDAIAVRELLFDALPGVDAASLRVFREPGHSPACDRNYFHVLRPGIAKTDENTSDLCLARLRFRLWELGKSRMTGHFELL